MNRVRQHFDADCEDALNNQINMELHASYVYLSMAYYCDRDDVALPGFHKYFKKASDDEREHAMKFMKYLNKRGGRLVLKDVEAPQTEWIDVKEAMTNALELEHKVNEALLKLHESATLSIDPNLLDFLETEYLQEQVDSIKEIADHITNLERVGDGVGLYMFDKEFLRE